MIHILRHWRSPLIVLEGPDVDIMEIWIPFKAGFDNLVGPQPNTIIYREYAEYAMRRLAVLRQYQLEYGCQGELQAIFVEFLKRDYWKVCPTREISI